MKHLDPKNFPVLLVSQYLPSLSQGAMSTVRGAGPFYGCIHQSGKSFLNGTTQDRLMLLQLTSEEPWFGLPMSLLFLQNSPGWELPWAFRLITASTSVFVEPSANHSQKEDQHWSAPLN